MDADSGRGIEAETASGGAAKQPVNHPHLADDDLECFLRSVLKPQTTASFAS